MTGALCAAISVGSVTPTGFATVNSPISGSISGAGPVVCGPYTVIASGGTAPYTYAATLQLGDASEWTINSPTAASSTVTNAFVDNSDLRQAIVKIVVTDNVAATTTLYVSVNARSTSTQ